MRDYDDHVRPHVVLRRIIIVVAVLTAIPVALWTVTGFVRSYVGPPKVPYFRQLATNVTEQQQGTGATTNASDWSLWQSVATFVRAHAGAPQIPSISQLTATITGNGSAGPEGSDRSSAAAERAKPPAASPLTVEARATATDAHDPSTSLKDQSASDANMPTTATKLPDASQGSMPAKSADVPVTLPAATRAGDFSTASVSTDPGTTNVWPSPSRQHPTSNTAAPWPAAPQTAATQQEAAQQNATEQPAAGAEPPADAAPSGQPLTGPIPLPRHRPSDLAMVQITAATVPMPRPRPDIAGSTTLPETTTQGPLNFLNSLFR
jgi:hypothetical protein